MSLKIRPPWPIPAETEKVGKVLLKEGSVYRYVGERLFEKIKRKQRII